MDSVNENRLNAEVAFSNRNYQEALMWYQKALTDEPNDLYLLSRAGAICVPLGQFDLALQYFGKAKSLDSENGDNYFNFANACFFNKDYAGSFESYVMAEKKGCSDDIMPRLYYQLAMICSLRQDLKSALIYFQKCQDIDKEGVFSISPDFISEKLKIYMTLQDYENAERCAALLVAADPTQFKNYMLYYSILMAHKDFDAAQKVLEDTEKYASVTDAEKNSVLLQKAALYMARGEQEPAKRSEYFELASTMLEEKLNSSELSEAESKDFAMVLSEVLMKCEKFDAAIRLLQGIVDETHKKNTDQPQAYEINDAELTDDEIEEMLSADMELIHDLVMSGDLADDMGQYADIAYDDEGNEINQYSDDAFASVDRARGETNVMESTVTEEAEKQEEKQGITQELREKTYFMLLSCYMEKENYSAAAKYASYLNGSNNKYYDYFGKYSSAVIARKRKLTPDAIRKVYDETLAFFRNKTFSDPGDNLAVIFRARLYAEDGKFEKAMELSRLLGEDDRKAVQKYIDECKGR